MNPFVARQLVKPSAITVAGLGSTAIYFILGAFLIPLPSPVTDTENFMYFARANFTWGASLIDMSALSPFQGLGGLIQPIGVWINLPYLLSHFLPAYDPRVWAVITVALIMLATTYLLARSVGLPAFLAVIGAQLVTIFSLPPMINWTRGIIRIHDHLYTSIPGIAAVTALLILLLAIFCFQGRLSTKLNATTVLLMPLLFIYCVLCDPLYTALFLAPFPLIGGGYI